MFHITVPPAVLSVDFGFVLRKVSATHALKEKKMVQGMQSEKDGAGYAISVFFFIAFLLL